jgi:hypothetical protein
MVTLLATDYAYDREHPRALCVDGDRYELVRWAR